MQRSGQDVIAAAPPELSPRRLRKVIREMEAFCGQPRRTSTLRGRFRLSYIIEGATVTLFAMRRESDGHGGWRRTTLARFRLLPERGKWYLEQADAQGTWRFSPRVRPCRSFGSLLRSYDRSSSEVFWG